MQQVLLSNLLSILKEGEVDFDDRFQLEFNPSFLDSKGQAWLHEIYDDLGGKGKHPLLEKANFDMKINRVLFLFDSPIHFNRYRLISLRSDFYSEMSFPFSEAYKRLCRTYEKECQKAGLQERIWNGPPVAGTWFGQASEPGDYSGVGASGWKLTAFNDAQIDLQSRIHGYKLIRIAPYETIMTGGSLKRLDQMLVNPNEDQRKVICNWFLRKLE
ncbi:MAG TPA: hypothetical protein DEQ87_11225 [Algoriphagus sp.]|jgi:hypothetical protein|uniref:Uncharacterized protein n=1 Tax=Algoriphagus ornithinivorans TaxID=226506 RepID=A0A1I5GXJ8_9BACT|nr:MULTISPECIES: hypothetical protein [Algoriphagus]MAL13238.1 hypothetical protein [Algoriphagus sp.]QYH38387.1 hypothetical protein GYM62_06065 [Algoriphagus sp. NBT04N3]SFO40715.1 hypothetical protein SAMN04488519_106135 [Algoriphagus ornithinivorans]HAD49834.1 hypothetical protein [Algoriphagus sp.]HAH35229.1 hypothetical protein [Algoriphagus sp.]|tara:strand:+ start:1905 stop:2549 length:645 start_codon:yes stop_codon:yes gene_type:complete